MRHRSNVLRTNNTCIPSIKLILVIDEINLVVFNVTYQRRRNKGINIHLTSKYTVRSIKMIVDITASYKTKKVLNV